LQTLTEPKLKALIKDEFIASSDQLRLAGNEKLAEFIGKHGTCATEWECFQANFRGGKGDYVLKHTYHHDWTILANDKHYLDLVSDHESPAVGNVYVRAAVSILNHPRDIQLQRYKALYKHGVMDFERRAAIAEFKHTAVMKRDAWVYEFLNEGNHGFSLPNNQRFMDELEVAVDEFDRKQGLERFTMYSDSEGDPEITYQAPEKGIRYDTDAYYRGGSARRRASHSSKTKPSHTPRSPPRAPPLNM